MFKSHKDQEFEVSLNQQFYLQELKNSQKEQSKNIEKQQKELNLKAIENLKTVMFYQVQVRTGSFTKKRNLENCVLIIKWTF